MAEKGHGRQEFRPTTLEAVFGRMSRAVSVGVQAVSF